MNPRHETHDPKQTDDDLAPPSLHPSRSRRRCPASRDGPLNFSTAGVITPDLRIPMTVVDDILEQVDCSTAPVHGLLVLGEKLDAAVVQQHHAFIRRGLLYELIRQLGFFGDKAEEEFEAYMRSHYGLERAEVRDLIDCSAIARAVLAEEPDLWLREDLVRPLVRLCRRYYTRSDGVQAAAQMLLDYVEETGDLPSAHFVEEAAGRRIQSWARKHR